MSKVLTARKLYQKKDVEIGDVFRIPYNKRGYVQIPRVVTRFLKLEPGDFVEVSGENGLCTLRACSGETFYRLQPCRGDLRLRKKYLEGYSLTEKDIMVTVLNAHLLLT